MNNEFVLRIKKIKDELLALKTASEYTSVRTSYIAPVLTVTTGMYQVNYNTEGQPILSQFYQRDPDSFCRIGPRTPSGNSQIVEINTTTWDNAQQQYITYENGLIVTSNVPVTGITRIG